jgi:hypothetical protein
MCMHMASFDLVQIFPHHCNPSNVVVVCSSSSSGNSTHKGCCSSSGSMQKSLFDHLPYQFPESSKLIYPVIHELHFFENS